MSIIVELRRFARVAESEGGLWLGRSGMLGVLLLLLAAIAFSWTPRIARDATTAEARYEVERKRALDSPEPEAVDPPSQLREFQEHFPESAQSLEDLRSIFRIAREQQLQLTHGDYASGRRAEAGLTTCDVVLPVKTSYQSLRAFVAAVLNELPNASLVELRMERTSGNQLNARVHLTLYYRET